MGDVEVLVDGWQLEVSARQISKGDVVRRIEPKAMQVLILLASHPGAVVSRAELLDQVWGGRFVGDDAVSAAIIKLRRAFEDDARSPRVIETVHKSGYRLIAPVSSGGPASSAKGGEHFGATNPSVKFVTLLRCVYRTVSVGSASVPPEEWQRSTDAIAVAIGDIIRAHGGVAIHESGATIGVFGAPIAQEHHAMRAVQAALDIRASRTAIPDSSHDQLDHTWRIGLASGEVLSSPAPPRSGLTIHGAPLEHAASLAVAAEPGEILLTGQTRSLAHGLVGARRCEIRPAQATVGEVYQLDVDAGWSTPWEARVERGLTPLFGREFEVNRISELLEGVASGAGRVVALGGEPGAGKSRLVHEALLLATAGGFDTLTATASPLEARTPFFPVRSLVMNRLGLDPDAFIDVPRLQTLLDANTTVVDDAEALLAALRPDDVGNEWTSLDPDQRRSRSVAALSSVILDGVDRPQLIVFEDLHWADETTRVLVDALVTQIARRPCMLIVTYRPEFADPWAVKSYHTPLRIDALERAASLQMLDHLVGDDASVEQWKEAVVGLAGGTPLFIEEVVQSAHAAGNLTRHGGAHRLTDAASPRNVPSSIHTLIADRVDRLSDGAREILSLAAVIGTDVPASLLHLLLPEPMTDRAADFEELQASELLFASRYQREPGYVFKHALTQEVAYREIPRSIRSDHHRKIAERLATLIGDGSPFSSELLARHRAGAGQHGLAVDAWIRASDAAISAAAFADALEHLDHARSSLDHGPLDDQYQLRLAVELRTMSALIQTVGPADPEVDAACRMAQELAIEHGTERQRYQAAWGSWFTHLMRGEINEARPLGDKVFELAGILEDRALQLEAHHVQWSGLSLAGDPKAVREHAQIGIEHYERSEHHWLTFSYGGHDPGVCAWNLNAMALWLLGQPDLAREHSAAAVALAEELGHPYTRLESFNSALNIALLDGDADALLTHSGVLLALVDNGTLPDFGSAYANGFRANAFVLQGRIQDGLDLMIESAPVWQEFWGAWCFPLDSAFATTLASAGRVDEAMAHVEMQLAAAEETGAHWWDAEFHRVLGELLLVDDPANLERAEGCFAHALHVSRQQRAPFHELRAGDSLAQMRPPQGV
jgi:DNA-binding winged helix-turn-helix (wHTH) protein